MFYIGEVKLTHIQRYRLDKIFTELRNKHLPGLLAFVERCRKGSKPKSHLEISGGNYTYSLVLPYLIPRIQKMYPLLPVRLSLFEINDGSRLHQQDAEIALRGDLVGDEENNRRASINAKNAGYFADRKKINDAMYLAASIEFVEKFGDPKYALDFGALLFERYYVDSLNVLRANPIYSMLPKSRQDEDPRLSVDQYYMKYFLMQEAVGIGHIYTTMTYLNNIDTFTLLDKEPFAKYIRFCLVKKDLNERYHNITKNVMQILKGQ